MPIARASSRYETRDAYVSFWAARLHSSVFFCRTAQLTPALIGTSKTGYLQMMASHISPCEACRTGLSSFVKNVCGASQLAQTCNLRMML